MIMRIFPKYHCPNCSNLNILANPHNDNTLANRPSLILPLHRI